MKKEFIEFLNQNIGKTVSMKIDGVNIEQKIDSILSQALEFRLDGELKYVDDSGKTRRIESYSSLEGAD